MFSCNFQLGGDLSLEVVEYKMTYFFKDKLKRDFSLRLFMKSSPHQHAHWDNFLVYLTKSTD